ncbi:hypothetical protein BHE74_00024361, partial [Ensete ventricosum]
PITREESPIRCHRLLLPVQALSPFSSLPGSDSIVVPVHRPLAIRKMDLEARSLQPSVKAGLLAKLREYKSDLNNLKSELKRITTPNPTQASREELLESGKADMIAV